MPDADWRDGPFPRREPSPESLAWAARSLGPGSRVTGRERLTGGVSSAVHGLTVETRRGVRRVVLRQYPPGLGLKDTVRQEVANLALVERSGLPVPTVVAADAAGLLTGGPPSILLTRLPGRVELSPSDPARWVRGLAELASQVHRADVAAPSLDPWRDSWIAPRDQLRVPRGAGKPGVWRAAIEAMQQPPPEGPEVFLHGDFLPVNVLWASGRCSGLVDWNSLHRGSPAVDVGQCRRYVASVFAPELAEQLRVEYESLSGQGIDPWWDIHALLHHGEAQATWIPRQVAGRRSVDTDGITARVEVVLEAAVRRLERCR